jgi:hypothetical protein
VGGGVRDELEAKLVARWPDWFDMKGNIQHTLMPFGFACGDGWFQIIWDLCEGIEKLGPSENFEVIQVKEKFGGLRFYTQGGGSEEEVCLNYDALMDLVHKAEEQSFNTCEECGAPGEVRNTSGWISTLCDTHHLPKPRLVPQLPNDQKGKTEKCVTGKKCK